ncbi:TPA_asm: Protein 3a [Piper methysticum polerovirus]|uniref:Protein 3a n=1 Tax=Piper methysticum polerovirus TaxID=2885088 RepID=A0AAD2KQ66_9VIRU|nr:TPA_asm: Protein 3a [Piper methysticum polerovirus]
MNFVFLAGFWSGFAIGIPVSVIGLYIVYLRISSHIRSIVNEYGRG